LVELWAIVSFGSGILFAIPQFNLIVHGTCLIVIHGMGLMIGVQVMLVFIAVVQVFLLPKLNKTTGLLTSNN